MQKLKYFENNKNFKVIDGQLAIVYPLDVDNLPSIKRQQADLRNVSYIGFQNIRSVDNRNASDKVVGFFMDDNKFANVCKRPWQYVNKLGQYKLVLSPDVSCYTDMSVDEQLQSTFMNRTIGAFWQSEGLSVVPTIAWSDKQSHTFAFLGVESGSNVAVSTIGTNDDKKMCLDGFIAMCDTIKPEAVLCYCKPYPEMHKFADIIYMEHEGKKAHRMAKSRPMPGQISFFDSEKEAI